MRIWRDLLLFTAICVLSSYCASSLYQLHSENRKKVISHFSLLPEDLAKAMTLEFSGIASDYLMLKTLTYMGEKLMERQVTTHDEWQMIYRALVQISNLDPRFVDTYVLAQMTLPFDAGMVEETNVLLKKAAKILTDDYRPYFFLWYNYFKFLDNQERAAYFLAKAAIVPGAPNYFSTLAARMSLYSGKTYAGVVLLQEMIKDTNDPAQLKFLRRRLQALQKIGFLELKTQEFNKRFQNFPKKLQDLVDRGIITTIPTDPYGGTFYIRKDGRVYTTSNLVLTKKEKQ